MTVTLDTEIRLADGTSAPLSELLAALGPVDSAAWDVRTAINGDVHVGSAAQTATAIFMATRSNNVFLPATPFVGQVVSFSTDDQGGGAHPAILQPGAQLLNGVAGPQTIAGINAFFIIVFLSDALGWWQISQS